MSGPARYEPASSDWCGRWTCSRRHPQATWRARIRTCYGAFKVLGYRKVWTLNHHYQHIKGRMSYFSSLASSISSGTALMPWNPFRNTTKTRLAPHLSAEVAQSNAVSPAPRTITVPKSWKRQRNPNCFIKEAHRRARSLQFFRI